MNKKNAVLILIVNIIFLLVITEFVCYITEIYGSFNSINKEEWKNSSIKEKTNIFLTKFKYFNLKHQSFDTTYDMIKKEKLKTPYGVRYSTPPILIMGCSYAYGYGLPDKDTFSYKLSEITKRPVYNRAFEWWWGPQTMLYQARNEDFYKEVPNPKYVIYILMSDHYRRICTSVIDSFFPYPHLRYVKRNGKLERENFSFLYNLYAFKKYTKYKSEKIIKEKSQDLLNEFFIETKNEFDKRWNNYKFIILVYDQGQEEKLFYQNSSLSKLKDYGFKIVYASDFAKTELNKPQFMIDAFGHPSALAWDLITKNFAKEEIINTSEN